MTKRKATPLRGPATEYRLIGDLVPYARNAKLHSTTQVAAIAASIDEFGYTNPVLADADGIVAGHGRVLGAELLYKQGKTLRLPSGEPIPAGRVPVLDCTGWTQAKRRAYIIADNALAEQAGWDEELLRGELLLLKEDGFDLALLGFPDEDIKAWTEDKASGNRNPADIPPLPVNARTTLGEVWLLGDHRLMCGSATEPSDVAELMLDAKAALLQTDPPYGIAYVKNAKSKGQSVGHVDIENDELDGPKLQQFLEDMIRAAVPYLHERCAFYLWHPMLTQGTFFAAAAAAADILIHRQIIWAKPSMVFGRGDYHWQHELCFYGWRRGFRPEFYGERNQTTLWPIERETSKEHPTAKPVDLWSRPIENHMLAGEVMYEPFSGSGSQIIAAEMAGRRCYAMELAPPYVDVAVRRWQDFTGKKATRESDGVTFDSLTV